MKYFTVFVFGLLTVSSASNSYDCNNKVDQTLITKALNSALNSTQAQYSFKNDIAYANEFKEMFKEAIPKFVNSVHQNLYRQAQEGTRNLTNNITRYSNDLLKALGTVKTHTNDYCLDNYLTSVINQSNILAALIPGNALIKRPGLPELPTLQIKPQDVPKKRTLNELFVHLDKVLDDTLSNGYSIITYLYLRGWAAVRLYFLTTQKQYRNEFLNDQALRVYVDMTKKLFRQSDLIKCHVKNETWTTFKTIGDRMISTYNDYVTSKKNDNCTKSL